MRLHSPSLRPVPNSLGRYAIGGSKDEWAVAQSQVASRLASSAEGAPVKTISIKSTKRKAEEEEKKEKRAKGAAKAKGGKSGKGEREEGGKGKKGKRS